MEIQGTYDLPGPSLTLRYPISLSLHILMKSETWVENSMCSYSKIWYLLSFPNHWSGKLFPSEARFFLWAKNLLPKLTWIGWRRPYNQWYCPIIITLWLEGVDKKTDTTTLLNTKNVFMDDFTHKEEKQENDLKTWKSILVFWENMSVELLKIQDIYWTSAIQHQNRTYFLYWT